MKSTFFSILMTIAQSLCLSIMSFADATLTKPIATKIGNTTLIFYRDSSDYGFSKQFVDSINDNFFVVMDQPHPNLTRMRNVCLINSGSSDKLNDFFSYTNHLAREHSNLELEVQYTKHECILNQDTHGFFTNENYLPSFTKKTKETSLLFENIFLYDWQLAKSTIGGCIFHDRKSKHRFVVFFEPHENLGILKLNKVTSVSDLEPLLWTFFAPIDLYGFKAVGSWKGKYMANVSRGMAYKTENFMTHPFEVININSKFSEDTPQKEDFKGIVLYKKEIPFDFSQDEGALKIIDNLSVIDLDLSCRIERSKQIQEQLKIEKTLSRVIKVIKRDDGFSAIKSVLHDLSENATVVILNTSQLPSSHSPYHLCENLGRFGIKMFQLYYFGREQVLSVTPEYLNYLYLTPANEVFYRKLHFTKFPENYLKKRLYTEIEIFIYE